MPQTEEECHELIGEFAHHKSEVKPDKESEKVRNVFSFSSFSFSSSLFFLFVPLLRAFSSILPLALCAVLWLHHHALTIHVC